MLDIQSDVYKNADHYCKQDKQKAIKFASYREYVKADEAKGIEEVLARPAIMPMRAEPEVKETECLKYYLLEIYKKTVNLLEAEKFLNTFKL